MPLSFPINEALALCVALLALSVGTTCGKSTDCRDLLISSDPIPDGTTCTNAWNNVQLLMRQTQFDVGYAWVYDKQQKDFSSSKHAQNTMDGEPIPAVLGPTSNGSYAFYVVDHHHTLAALDMSGYISTEITISVACDDRDLDLATFWTSLIQKNLVFTLTSGTEPFDEYPTNRSPSSLPTSFRFNNEGSSFGNNVWRSLGSYVRKVQNSTCTDSKYCMRCYNRACAPDGSGVPFFEFKWGYFFLDLYATDPNYWVSSTVSYSQWKQQLATIAPLSYSSTDVDSWNQVAEAMIATCRANGTGSYTLPASFPSTGGQLPGYTNGWQPLPSDPDCSPATC